MKTTHNDIKTPGDATKRTIHLLTQQNINITRTQKVSAGRHTIIHTEHGQLYLMFKRAPFLNYGKELGQTPSQGETTNINIFRAIQSNPHIKLILFAYPNGKVYGITPQEYAKHGTQRHNPRMIENSLCIPFTKLQPLTELIGEWKL